MNIDLIKKIIDNKISKGLDKNLPDAHRVSKTKNSVFRHY